MSKITKIEPHMFFPGSTRNFLLIRVETDDGYFGWGEAYVSSGKEEITLDFMNFVSGYLIGRDVFDVKHTGWALFNDLVIRRGSIDFFASWSAIEIAMYDIMGKITKQPVYNLIGGRCREKVRVYANGWWAGLKTIDEVVNKALEVKKMGYTALKWDPFFGPWRTFITQKDEDAAVENVKCMREALGPDMELLVEVHRRLSPYHAIHFADRIEEYRPFWFEEPCCADNVNLIEQVKEKTHLRIVTGETLYTREDYIDVFEKRATDIINPDIAICNGIHGIMEIASMAEPYGVAFSPHNSCSTTVALAAMLHVSAAAPNFLIAEVFLNLKKGCDSIMVNPFEVKDGFIDLPTSPGLGVDIDMEALLSKPMKKLKKEFPYKGVAEFTFESPKPADFSHYR
ncbi:MAG: mandelate racemase/muconate lactonizing enzyme family protein [Oscillospiraceae bacterium]|nr:mandelate racemase/muconate lactonizing enzyme family protein [Oscillospiraceae bacterium]